MKRNRGPQRLAGAPTCETKVRKIQRDQCAVGQHADERRTRPAGDPESNHGNAGHAPNRYGDAGKFLTQQQIPDQRGNQSPRDPVAASATAAKINTHFIESLCCWSRWTTSQYCSNDRLMTLWKSGSVDRNQNCGIGMVCIN